MSDLPLDVDEEVLAEVEDEGIVYTAGVSSAVLDGDEAVGHVLLLDCDDVDQITVYNAAASMDGITAVFESSTGSFHIWNLTVHPWEDAILTGLSWRVSDAEHVKQSYRRGRYVLRTTAKVREDAETGSVVHYKEAPRLLDVFVDLDRDGEDEPVGPQSLPHLRRLASIADEQDADVEIPSTEDVVTVGAENGLGVDRYMTITDDAKAALRGDA